MAVHKQSPRSPADQAKAADEALNRLTQANRGLQLEVAERLRLDGAWNPDSLLRALIDHVPDHLFIKDNAGRFVVANRAVAAELGLEPEDLIGKTDFELNPPEFAERIRADEDMICRTGRPMLEIEESNLKDGRTVWYLSSKVPYRNEHGEIIGLIGISRDITVRKEAQDQVKFLAHHDALTRLPNRTLFMERLEHAIVQARQSDRWVALGFVDLDRFKNVNDDFGHAAGDELLKTVARRMVGCVRATDAVVRLGGDEFILLLPDQPKDLNVISATFTKVRTAIARPTKLGQQTIRVTSSVGVATFPSDASDAETLLKNADTAMYQAKAVGRDKVQFFGA